MQTPEFAVMYPIGTLNPQEAARFWQEKKEREEQTAADAEEQARQRRAKVVRPGPNKGPRTSGGAHNKSAGTDRPAPGEPSA